MTRDRPLTCNLANPRHNYRNLEPQMSEFFTDLTNAVSLCIFHAKYNTVPWESTTMIHYRRRFHGKVPRFFHGKGTHPDLQNLMFITHSTGKDYRSPA
jgi:hypothetical protein